MRSIMVQRSVEVLRTDLNAMGCVLLFFNISIEIITSSRPAPITQF